MMYIVNKMEKTSDYKPYDNYVVFLLFHVAFIVGYRQDICGIKHSNYNKLVETS